MTIIEKLRAPAGLEPFCRSQPCWGLYGTLPHVRLLTSWLSLKTERTGVNRVSLQAKLTLHSSWEALMKKKSTAELSSIVYPSTCRMQPSMYSPVSPQTNNTIHRPHNAFGRQSNKLSPSSQLSDVFVSVSKFVKGVSHVLLRVLPVDTRWDPSPQHRTQTIRNSQKVFSFASLLIVCTFIYLLVCMHECLFVCLLERERERERKWCHTRTKARATLELVADNWQHFGNIRTQ